MLRVTFVCTLLIALASFALQGQTKKSPAEPPPPTDTGALPWNELGPGQYTVGYRVIYTHDRSRTWQNTRLYGKPFSPDMEGRPVRISVWYPAVVPNHRNQMTILDYIHLPSPANFLTANEALEARDRRVLAEMVPPNSFDALLRTPMRAYYNAPAAAGRLPLAMYSGGVNSYTLSNAIMAELLASHGYVVAAVPSLGPSDLETEQHNSPEERMTALRDLEFAWGEVRQLPYVDGSKLGAFGHSLGGTTAVLFSMRNSNVSAVIGLDGTYGFANPGNVQTLTAATDYAPKAMRSSLLDIHRSDTELDLSTLHALVHADRTEIVLPHSLHGDFTTFVVLARTFHLPPPTSVPSGYTRETGYAAYRNTTQLVLAFFDACLKGAGSGNDRIGEIIAGINGATITRESAVPAPPSAGDLGEIVAHDGLEAAIRIVDRFQKEQPDAVDAAGLNSLGYLLSNEGQHRQAIDVLRLVVHAYPNSANAEDSLGDAYLAAGDTANAKLSFERALRLVGGDDSLSAQSKSELVRLEEEKLAHLK